jgi:hypothetical protein
MALIPVFIGSEILLFDGHENQKMRSTERLDKVNLVQTLAEGAKSLKRQPNAGLFQSRREPSGPAGGLLEFDS